MEKRWNVYHGIDYLGLKTAKEIREALRQGTLDPFDKVSLEGSTIREDLIEVDEIFGETERAESASSVPQDPPGPLVAKSSPPTAHIGKPTDPPPKVLRPETYEEIPESDDIEDFSQRNDTGTRNTLKRYYLIDRDKVLGPLSALEIQSLFNRSMLNKKVRVQKIGSGKTIAITHFIASYSGDRLKELTDEGRVPQQIGVGSPSSKVMNELARMANSRRVTQDRKNQAYLLFSLFGLILGAAVYVFYEQLTSPPLRSNRPAGAEEAPEEEAPEASKPAKSRPRLIQKALEPVNRPEPPPKKKSEPPRSEPVKQAESRPARRIPAPAITKASQGSGESRGTDNIPQSPGPIAKAIEAAGRIQTVGPLTFNPNALDACSSKCILTLFDATGASMKAVFFKNAYSEQLRSRAKGATLTGNTKIDRGELTLFIQDVR